MSEFEVLRLIAAFIAMLVVATIVLVVFFRGLTWFDNWRKTKRRFAVLDKSKPPRKRPRSTESGVRSEARTVSRKAAQRPIAATKHQTTTSTQKYAALNGQHEEPIDRANRLVSTLKRSRTENKDHLLREPHHGELALAQGRSTEASEVSTDTIVATNRRASIHLISGEIIPNAQIISVNEFRKRLLDLGLDQRSMTGAIVFEDHDRRVFWVRLENIKMISWSVE